jgi:hypothetical protein
MADVHRFSVYALAEAQSLPRLLVPFTQRDLLPRTVEAKVAGDQLTVVIEHCGLAPETAALIAERMRASITVREVELATL